MPDAGWYQDPGGAPQHRYFDGEGWTEDVRPFAAPMGSPVTLEVDGVPDEAPPAPSTSIAGDERARSLQRRVAAVVTVLLVAAAVTAAVSRNRGTPDATGISVGEDDDVCVASVAGADDATERGNSASSGTGVLLAQQEWADIVMRHPACFDDDDVEIAGQLALGEVDAPDLSSTEQVVEVVMHHSWDCPSIAVYTGDEARGRIYGDGVLLANYAVPLPDDIWDGDGCAIPVTITIPDTVAWEYRLTWFKADGESDVWLKTRDELAACGWRTGVGC